MSDDRDKQAAEQERDDKGRFVPGVSGNPKGRPPKERALSDNLRAHLNDVVIVEEKRGRKTVKVKKTRLQLFIESQIARAIEGDPQAARNVWERIEGRVAVALSNEDGEAFSVIIEKEMDGI